MLLKAICTGVGFGSETETGIDFGSGTETGIDFGSGTETGIDFGSETETSNSYVSDHPCFSQEEVGLGKLRTLHD